MHSTDIEYIKKSRKRRRCDWCGEFIKIGQSYKRWRYFDGNHAGTAKVHPECSDAVGKYYQESGEDEWDLHEHARGCLCEPGFCQCRKYVLYPGHIYSKNDGQLHFINAQKLAELYNVNLKNCIIIDHHKIESEIMYIDQLRGIDLDKLIHLYPRFDGNY